MRVLQLHAGYRVPAGEDSVVANEAAALVRGGHAVRSHIDRNPSAFGPTINALARSWHNTRSARNVTEQIREFRPDVVHVHNTWFALSSSVIAAASDTGVPVVMTIHNYRLGCLGADLFRGDAVCTSCVGRVPINGVLHGCYRDSRALSAIAAVEVTLTRRRRVLDTHVDRFVSPSAFMRDRLIDIGVPGDRLVVKPHFVADPGPRTQSPSRSNEILYIGRLATGKGLETLLRAWERVSSARRAGGADEWNLSIIGDGPLAPKLREIAPRGVRFDGWVPRDEVVRRLLAARAFVFPSVWYEPFGMVLVEALSCGLPIVTTNASEAPAITAAPDSLTVPVDDDVALAAAIDRLDDATVDAVGPANRRRFETHFTEAVGLQRLEQLYDDVLTARASRSPR